MTIHSEHPFLEPEEDRDPVRRLRGRIGGAALDVYESEPCTDSPLFGLPGVVCTPHLGASTEEAQTQVATEAVELLDRYFRYDAFNRFAEPFRDAAAEDDERRYEFSALRIPGLNRYDARGGRLGR